MKDLVLGGSAVVVGIVTKRTLEDGSKSTDLSYVLPEARSAVVFAVPIDQGVIEPFFNTDSGGPIWRRSFTCISLQQSYNGIGRSKNTGYKR